MDLSPMLLSDRDPFGLKSWREYLNQSSYLIVNGLTLKNVIDSLSAWDVAAKRALEEELSGVRVVDVSRPACPNCGGALQVFPVNVSPGTQTGDNSKSVLLCAYCGHDHYSLLTPEEVIRGQTA